MYQILGAFLLTPFLAATLAAGSPNLYCPLLGPVFPPPQNLNDSPTWHDLRENITATLHSEIQKAKTSEEYGSVLNFTSTSFALQIFSTSDSDPLLFEAYTSETTREANIGVQEVDQDTVFRIGSGSKLWTTLLLLKELGDGVFSDPVSKYVPELAAAEVADGVSSVRWDEVTVGELVSHMAGIARDYGFLDLAFQPDIAEAVGLPELPKKDIPPCGQTGACDRKEFFDGLLQSHPVVPTGSTPIYSNAAFQILSYVVENATKRKFQDIFQEELVGSLGLKRSYYSAPSPELGVIPGDPLSSFWAIPTGDETPAGGFFSSVQDMATVGQAILNSTLLTPDTTRRWLKPVAHTSSLDQSIGAPWEIFSFQEPRLIDLYTKSGDLGSYSSMLALSPDHDVGFTILAAGDSSGAAVRAISDLLGKPLLRGLDQVAKENARQSFVGTYALPDGSSQICLTTDDGPGLKVDRWTSDSKNVFTAFMQILGVKDPSKLEIRLYPTGLSSPGKISFRAVPVNLEETLSTGPFTGSCSSWSAVGGQVYGNVAVDEFVFDVNDEHEVLSVSPRALRVTLPKD